MPGKRSDGQLCLRGMAGIRPRKPRSQVEAQEQRAFFVWLRLHSKAHPELRWVHAIPNGLWLGPKRGGNAPEPEAWMERSYRTTLSATSGAVLSRYSGDE